MSELWSQCASSGCDNKSQSIYCFECMGQIEAYMNGKSEEHDRILDLTYDDEVMHNIWWLIKREDVFPSQDFIAEIIRHFLLIKKEKENE